MSTAKKSPLELRLEQEIAEYSTYRAIAPIPFGNTIAFQPGHPVPVSHVEQYRYDEQGLVEKLTGEARQQAVDAASYVPDENQQ